MHTCMHTVVLRPRPAVAGAAACPRVQVRLLAGCCALLALLGTGVALDNGQAKTPPMGFNPWNIWGKMNGGAPRAGPGGVAGFTQAMLEQTAEAHTRPYALDLSYLYL